MGLLPEESLIAQRLGRLSRKKEQTPGLSRTAWWIEQEAGSGPRRHSVLHARPYLLLHTQRLMTREVPPAQPG